MKIIGITGGMGAGKSTVSSYLEEKGYRLIDADKIAREITEKGSPVLAELAEEFGADIIDADGNLRRKHLAHIAFSDKRKQQRLNEIMHGRIKEIILQRRDAYEQAGEKTIFLDVPLLIEAGLDEICDSVWVICAPDHLKIRRIKKRDHAAEHEIKKRIALQLTDEERLSSSGKTIRIDNEQDVEGLCRKIDERLDQ